MENETFILGMYENDVWSFYTGEDWVHEVKKANKMDKGEAFDLCEKFAEEDLHVVVFKSKIFEFENCPSSFSFKEDH